MAYLSLISGVKTVPQRRIFSEWSVLLWIAALALAIFGFSGLAGTATWIVQILTVVFALFFLGAAVLFRPPQD